MCCFKGGAGWLNKLGRFLARAPHSLPRHLKISFYQLNPVWLSAGNKLTILVYCNWVLRRALGNSAELSRLCFHRGIDIISPVWIEDALIFVPLMQLVIHQCVWGGCTRIIIVLNWLDRFWLGDLNKQLVTALFRRRARTRGGDLDHVRNPFVSFYFWDRISWRILLYFQETKLFGMTLKARAGSAPFLLRSTQGIKVSIAAISANDLGEQTLVS